MKIGVHCFVSGRVQGVSFRSFTTRVAEKLGLTGWVKNLPDGRVESVVEGEEKNVEKFLKLLNKGSILSRVDKVKVEKEKYTGMFSDFEVLY
ncbi:MAG: acylphosphatase [Candidatus Aenigmarchaeota archaeon]|nr:acylphosphatase [Candidatus Aenigmarchaeota archaeon]